MGGLQIDGLGDGVWMNYESDQSYVNQTALEFFRQAGLVYRKRNIFHVLLGRTLFDLQETTAKIRKRTDHLKGIKIGIMGCIVNGPGEMADADYGYVGTGPGLISLYKGQEVVKRNIQASDASMH